VVLQDAASVDDVASAHGVAKSHVYDAVFNGFAGKVPPGRVNALRNDPNVVSVTENHIVSANPKPDGSGGGKGGGKDKNKPPEVTISSPADNSSFTPGTSVTLVGFATDDKDGDVSASIVWTSDIDDLAPSNTGAGSIAVSLSDGTHTITASVTDSGSKTGSASITVTMGNPPPPPSNQIVPSGVARIGAAPGDNLQTGAGIGVAIIDSGVDPNHSDLNVSATCFSAIVGSTCDDDNGHGTHVAGIVGALNNSQDVVGVAPGVTIYAVKVLNAAGSGSDAEVIAGLNWVKNHNDIIQVANMSLGRNAESDTVDGPMHIAVDAVVAAGITVVVSAGNSRFQEISDMVPASFLSVMAIASSTAQDGASPSKGRCSGMQVPADSASLFTTDGAGVAVSAPGNSHEDISKGCTMSGTGILSLQLGGGTTRKSGTSMAAPHVTGVVALLWEQANSNSAVLSPADAKNRISNGAVLVGSAPIDSLVSGCSNDNVKEGILNAAGALVP
jgi:subtilisin family serine protease